MCKVDGKLSSKELSARLLKEYNILIKDLSDKKGFSKKSFIRVAVKNVEENQYFLNSLKEIIDNQDSK